MARIMIVDDEENVLRALQRALRQDDREIECFTDPTQALRRAQVTPFDVIIADYRMPDMDGVQFMGQIRELQPETMRLLLSGMADMEALEGAINHAEVYRFVAKPWSDEALRALVVQALEKRQQAVENRYLAERAREAGDEPGN